MALLGKMAVLFVYMMIGYFCFRRGLLDRGASKVMSFLVLNIASPALVISGTVNRSGEIAGGELLKTVVIAVCLFAGLILIAFVLPLFLRIPKENWGTYRLMTIFSNIGFMGFPVVQAMLGSEALLHAAIFLIPYNLLIYTYGIYELTKDQGEGSGVGFAWRKMINVGVISCFIAIGLYLLNREVPQFLKETVSGLGNLTAPLSMIVIGIALAQFPLKSLFTDGKLLLFTGIKLIVLPLIGMMILKQFTDNSLLLGVSMVMMSTPVGSMTAMMAEQYGGDTELTSKGVALSTLLSVVTIPIVGMLTF